MLVYLAKHPEAFDPRKRSLYWSRRWTAPGRPLTSRRRFGGRDKDARNAVARFIVDLALRGERDRQRLIHGAVLRFKL